MDLTKEGDSGSAPPGPSRPGRGISLPHRPASVVVHGKNEELQEESEEGGASLSRRDSLEKTRDFYGFRPSSSASNMKDSTSLRLSKDDRLVMRQRSDSRVSHTTRGSTYTRPTSPDAPSVTSPRRSTTTLPTPRAFLTPKKPQAAMRMEQLEREKARQSQQPPLPSLVSTLGEPSPSRSTEETSPERPGHVPTASQSRNSISTQGSNAITGLALHRPDPHLTRIEESFSQSPLADSSLRHTTTNLSTPPHIHQELSSDDLVHPNTSPSRPAFPPKSPSPPRRPYTRANPSRESERPVRIRRYKKFENIQTTFFAGGHLMTGGDYPFSAILTVVIILGLTGVWLGTTGVWLWVHGNEYGLARGGGVGIVIVLVYLFGLVMSSLVVAAFRDPGIIPRNLDPEPPVTQYAEYYEPDNRDLTVKKRSVTVKYCETCKTYRPPRTSHCRLCGNCVDGIDHHCSYLHNCIGKRNYLPFLTLLVSAAIADIYIVVFSAIHFSLLCSHDNISFGKALRESPGAAVSFLLGIICLGPVLFLLWYHLRLLLYNLTTVEQIRASTSSNLLFARTRPDNPFSTDSLWSNMILASLGRPLFPSWVNASGWHEDDKRLINPALTDPRWSPQGGKSAF